MRRRIRSFAALVLAFFTAFGAAGGSPANSILPEAVYGAAEAIHVTLDASSIRQGSSEDFDFVVANQSGSAVTYNKIRIVLPSAAKGLSIPDFEIGGTDSMDNGKYRTYGVTAKADTDASTGSYDCKLQLLMDGFLVAESGSFKIRVTERSSTAQNISSGYRIYEANISFDTNHGGGLETGDDNTITFRIENIGTTAIRNAKFSIMLPEGLSVGSGSSTTENLGIFSEREVKEVSFPISVSKGLYKKNYAFSVALTGVGFGSGSDDTSVSVERAFYVYVDGTKSEDESEDEGSLYDVALELTTTPAEGLKTGGGNSLDFKLTNGGKNELKNASLLLELPDGVAMTSGGATNTSLGTLKAGESRNLSFPIVVEKGLYKKTYTVKAVLRGSESSVERTFYVYIDGTKELGKSGEEDDDNASKNPQIMVRGYNFGGGSIAAGQSFSLNLSLYNTSDVDLRNIKVTAQSSDGAFVPNGQNSSVFIEELASKGTAQGTLSFSTSPDAAQESHGININMLYEDMKGNSYNSQDEVSVAVTQATRFVVEEVQIPSQVYMGEQSYASVSYYNMGKTQIFNLRVKILGEGFDTVEPRSSYIGNVASGASDDFSFSFTPQGSEQVSGSLEFTYEDSAGNQLTQIAPFSFTAEEMIWDGPGWDDGMDEIPQPQQTNWKLYLGIAAAVIVALILLLRILKRRRMNKLLKLEQEEDEEQ